MRKFFLIFTVFLVGCAESTATETNYDSFVTCLNQAGVHLYTSATCPHCHEQLEMFGESAERLNVTDCYYDQKTCAEKNIRSVPAWIFAGDERAVGLQSFEFLSQKTGCNLPQ